MTDVVVYIGATSPLFVYEPDGGQDGSAWVQNSEGASQCRGPNVYAVQLNGLFCEFMHVRADPSHRRGVCVAVVWTV
jgi:hypothetical protein